MASLDEEEMLGEMDFLVCDCFLTGDLGIFFSWFCATTFFLFSPLMLSELLSFMSVGKTKKT